jgi:hypothetical protein
MNTMTRQQAVDAGLTRYFTGKPCKHGHIAERRMSDGCVVCADLHARKWQADHPEKVKAKSKRYHAENREKVSIKNREWGLKNPEKRKAATRNWREANTDRMKAIKAAWRKRKAGDVNEMQMRRHADKMKRTPRWVDREALCLIYRAAKLARTTWPELDPEVDHVIPLRNPVVSGLHVHNNLQILSGNQNRAKSNQFQGAQS